MPVFEAWQRHFAPRLPRNVRGRALSAHVHASYAVGLSSREAPAAPCRSGCALRWPERPNFSPHAGVKPPEQRRLGRRACAQASSARSGDR
jgi:hypothetical protein